MVLRPRSSAELVYGRTGLLEGFDPNIRTMDIDFLIRERGCDDSGIDRSNEKPYEPKSELDIPVPLLFSCSTDHPYS